MTFAFIVAAVVVVAVLICWMLSDTEPALSESLDEPFYLDGPWPPVNPPLLPQQPALETAIAEHSNSDKSKIGRGFTRGNAPQFSMREEVNKPEHWREFCLTIEGMPKLRKLPPNVIEAAVKKAIQKAYGLDTADTLDADTAFTCRLHFLLWVRDGLKCPVCGHPSCNWMEQVTCMAGHGYTWPEIAAVTHRQFLKEAA